MVDLAPGPGATPLPAGATVVPGFVDPHLHLLAGAAARCSLDLGPVAAPDLATLSRLVAEAARRPRRRDGWVRGVGFDEALLADPAPGTDPLPRTLLDRAAPSTPVVVHHAAGHVVHANAAALAAMGVDPERDDASPGVLRRPGGAATGVLTARSTALDRVPPLGREDLARALGAQAAEHLAAGLVAVTDATVTNDAQALDLLDRLLPAVGPTVTAMVAPHALAGGDLRFGRARGRLTVGHAKVVVEGDEPDDATLAASVRTARDAGHPVATHVTDVDGLARLLDVLARHPRRPGAGRDRVEHASLCLPEQVDALADAGVVVVTQPSFLTHRGAKYAAQFGPVEQDWLYRVATLRAAGVVVAASSDAPVVPARPLESLVAAVTRALGPAERVDAATALTMLTVDAAAAGPTTAPGVVAPGARADLVVLDRDPVTTPPAELGAITVLATVMGGRLVHRAA